MNKKNIKVIIASLCIIIAVFVIIFVKKSNAKMEIIETKYSRKLETEPIEEFMSCFYGGTSEIIYENPERIISDLNKSGNYNSITLPIAWSIVESVESQYDFSAYENVLNAITNAGYNMIIVIDTGGRPILKNNVIVDTSTIPDWLFTKYPTACSQDFEGNKTNSLDYFAGDATEAIKKFYKETIDWVGNNYGDYVEGFAPGIMSEFEIKYPQTGFRWESYSEKAQNAYRAYLKEKYINVDNVNAMLGTDISDFSEITMPVVNYNNSIVSVNTEENGLYTELMEFRENQIVRFTKQFTDIIKNEGWESIGYFGQCMFPIDAIYCTGVILKCVDLFDIAVIDYNFYDGYKEVYDSDWPPFLTNMVANLGYKKVYTGIYFERISLDGRQEFVSELNRKITIDGHSSGLEIGSLTNNTSEKVDFSIPKEVKKEKSKVAIYTSEWNYYKTHGESEAYLNYLSDSTIKLFSVLQYELGIPVEVITDTNVLQGQLKEFEILFLPCQMYVSDSVVKEIETYALNGGNIIQDFRYNEYDNYGNAKNEHNNELFGIGAVSAKSEKTKIRYMKEKVKLPIEVTYENIPTHYYFAKAHENHEYMFEKGKNSIGIKTDNTIVWGVQPQLQYFKTGDSNWLYIINESIRILQ